MSKMPTPTPKLKKIKKGFIYLSVLLNTVLFVLVLRQANSIKEGSELLEFLSSPILSLEVFYKKSSVAINKFKIKNAIKRKSFCTSSKMAAFKFQFKENGKVHIFIKEIMADKGYSPFSSQPTYIGSYLVTNNSVSWSFPIPGDLSSWRIIAHIKESTNEIYFRDRFKIISQQNCHLLTSL